MINELPIANQKEYEHLLRAHGKQLAERYKKVVLNWMNSKSPLTIKNISRQVKKHKKHFYQGKYRSTTEIALMSGISDSTIRKRIREGLTPEQAVAQGARSTKPKKIQKMR